MLTSNVFRRDNFLPVLPMPVWIIAVTRCLSVFHCPSVTSQYCIKATGWIELVHGTEASLATQYYKEIRVSPKVTVLPSGTFPKL